MVRNAKNQYTVVIRTIGAIYIAMACVFFFLPDQTFYLMNFFPKLFNLYETIPEAPAPFWVAPASTLMLVLAFICFLSAQHPRRVSYKLILSLSNLVIAGQFTYLFLTYEEYFAYLLGIGIHSFIAMIVSWYLIRLSIRTGEPSFSG